MNFRLHSFLNCVCTNNKTKKWKLFDPNFESLTRIWCFLRQFDTIRRNSIHLNLEWCKMMIYIFDTIFQIQTQGPQLAKFSNMNSQLGKSYINFLKHNTFCLYQPFSRLGLLDFFLNLGGIRVIFNHLDSFLTYSFTPLPLHCQSSSVHIKVFFLWLVDSEIWIFFFHNIRAKRKKDRM